ncbi:MAG TPA: hypothetical protein VFS82_04095 [Lysobacter sp.]|nr:hypothetical protein [Lysobacter sp.]
MGKLKVPSLQHLARHWRSDPVDIQRVLVGLTKGGPTFSYEPLHAAVRDMLVLNVPCSQIEEGIKRGVKNEDVRQNFLGLIPLIQEYFDGVSATFVTSVASRFYPVGRDLMVPFHPPLIYGSGGDVYFPWLSFWRSNPLAGERLSLFVTMVQDILLQDSDLDEAKFNILDFSAPDSKSDRKLTVLDSSSIPRLSQQRKVEMLTIFSEGYRLARDATVGQKVSQDIQRESDGDSSQINLFD